MRRIATLVCSLAGLAIVPAPAATLAERVKEMQCTSRPQQVAGTGLYKCQTNSTTAFFSVDTGGGAATAAPPPSPSRSSTSAASAVPAPPRSTNGFPRVDPETQRGRDDVRRRVLQDELSAEEKLLAEARAAFADGAPPPLAEERTNADKYRERIARLRQSVALHERNVEALRKEIAGLR